MTSILDAFPYPFVDPVAQELHLTLTRLHPTAQGALAVAERAGLDRSYVDAGQPPIYLWRDILAQAAQNGQTRDLVRAVRSLLNDASPRARFLDDLLAGGHPLVEQEPRDANGRAVS